MAPLSSASVKQQEASAYELQFASRLAPLMGANEASNAMSEGDAMACQGIEVFEASETEASDEELLSQLPTLTAGNIGIRCSYCANSSSSSDAASPKEMTVFPASMETMADSVRILSESHLGKCRLIPSSARESHRQAAEKRKINNEQERGSSWQEDERSLLALREWCHRFCQRQGIVDKGPNGAGLIFLPYYAPVGAPMYSDILGPPSRRRDRAAMMPGDYRGPMGGYDAYGEGYYAAQDTMAQGPDGPEGQQGMSAVQQQMPPMDMESLPFYQEPNGCWSCKYCSHLPPPYRQPQSMWGAPNHVPPPPQYMDQHLTMCRSYHHSISSQPMFPGSSQGQVPFMAQAFPGAGMGGPPQLGGWEGGGPPQAQSMSYTAESPASPFPQTPRQSGRNSAALSSSPTLKARRPESSDAAVQNAIALLSAADREHPYSPGVHNDEGPLVLDEDQLLLTDYFFHLMKQLRLCRFSEADRKTRGGKREKIVIGFGGLQCIHCSEANNTRKFFWSNVDRLANSFAEIPGHVLKCRSCPQQTKDALLQLKQMHPEQMARLPRGSQKVFFRRMWRRLHDDDPEAPSPEQEAIPPRATSAGSPQDSSGDAKVPALQTKGSGNDSSPGATTGSEESILLMQRSTTEAAKVLADSSSLPPSPNSRVLLAIPEDKEWLSDTDCFIRRQVEVFCASADDVDVARSDRKFPIHEGQVGIRCIHCALSKQGARGSAVAYPFSVSGIYESIREFQRLHLDACENLPAELKVKLSDLKGSTSLSSVLRKYYVLAAKALGLKDTKNGIRAGAGSVPIGSQAAFAFSDSTVSEEMRSSKMPSSFGERSSPENLKRKSESPDSSAASKRPHS